MSKVCQYCGAEMDNDAYECPECLKKDAGAELIFKQKEAERKLKRKSNMTIAGIAAAVVLIITGLVVLVVALNRKPSFYYSKPIKTYLASFEENNYTKNLSVFNEALADAIEENRAYIMRDGQPAKDKAQAATGGELYLDEYFKALRSRYGQDFEISFKVLSEKQMTPEQLVQYKEEFKSMFEKEVEISDGYELKIVFTIQGSLGKKSYTKDSFFVLKMDDKWKIIDEINFLEEETTQNDGVQSMY